jgi:hypothetical protein
MSNLTSTTSMVAQLQTRVPIGLSSTFWMTKLNEAYRWISQKGNFIWDVKYANITLNSYVNTFSLPPTCDPGKPMVLVGPLPDVPNAALELNSVVTYVPWDVAMDQRYSEMSTIPGLVSCWTFATNFTAGPPPTYGYTAYIFPLDTVITNSQFRLVYHTDVASTEIPLAANQYFPTPNSFDNLLIELAEAEARRIYGLAGWDIIQKRAESAITSLLDSYRSTKNVLAGLTDQQKQVNERKLMAQERA